jgi:hypothetical protein
VELAGIGGEQAVGRLHARADQGRAIGVDLDAERFPSQRLGHHQRGAEAGERVEHRVTRIGQPLDEEADELLREANVVIRESSRQRGLIAVLERECRR